MLIKKGDIYRNRETNIACFIRQVKHDSCQVVWSFKYERGVGHWGRPLHTDWEEVIEGPDGYIEYRCTKRRSDVINEMSMGYLNTESYGYEDTFILNWIPQHSFIAAI